MTQPQKDAYREMYRTLSLAMAEIHNPGASRSRGFDIQELVENVRAQARRAAPKVTSFD
jgi:hypothetical protein